MTNVLSLFLDSPGLALASVVAAAAVTSLLLYKLRTEPLPSATSSPPLPSLRIDNEKAVEKICSFIRDLVAERSAKGAVLGLSGGVDSAVLATLAVRALSRDRVHAFHLPDRDSEKESEDMARLLADWLGLQLRTNDIEPVLRERGVYDKPAVEGATNPGFNRFISASYRRLFGETGFMSTLRRGDFKKGSVKKFCYDLFIRDPEESFNARHRYRREYLEQKAREEGWILLGAANRSECMVGWFVKDGVDDLPFSPLMALYKTQVLQLATHLYLPEEIMERAPSPDMLKGLTDEFSLDIQYDHLDAILDGINDGVSDGEMLEWGVTAKEVTLVREMHGISAWKRESPHEKPPVDGTREGGLRM